MDLGGLRREIRTNFGKFGGIECFLSFSLELLTKGIFLHYNIGNQKLVTNKNKDKKWKKKKKQPSNELRINLQG